MIPQWQYNVIIVDSAAARTQYYGRRLIRRRLAFSISLTSAYDEKGVF